MQNLQKLISGYLHEHGRMIKNATISRCWEDTYETANIISQYFQSHVLLQLGKQLSLIETNYTSPRKFYRLSYAKTNWEAHSVTPQGWKLDAARATQTSFAHKFFETITDQQNHHFHFLDAPHSGGNDTYERRGIITELKIDCRERSPFHSIIHSSCKRRRMSYLSFGFELLAAADDEDRDYMLEQALSNLISTVFSCMRSWSPKNLFSSLLAPFTQQSTTVSDALGQTFVTSLNRKNWTQFGKYPESSIMQTCSQRETFFFYEIFIQYYLLEDRHWT